MVNAAWQVEDIKKEVESMQILFQARPSLLAQRDKFVQQLQWKVESVQLTSQKTLLDMFQLFEESRLPQELKQHFLDLLDTRATAGSQEQAVKVVGKTQQVDSLVKYFTQAELDALSHRDCWNGCHIVAVRLRKLG